VAVVCMCVLGEGEEGEGWGNRLSEIFMDE
jgi:hypothetical protein